MGQTMTIIKQLAEEFEGQFQCLEEKNDYIRRPKNTKQDSSIM